MDSSDGEPRVLHEASPVNQREDRRQTAAVRARVSEFAAAVSGEGEIETRSARLRGELDGPG